MHNRKERILILFNGEHIAYSPTVIQLYDELQKICCNNYCRTSKSFNNQKLENRNVLYHKFYHVKGRYFYWILFQILSVFNEEAKFFKRNNLNYKEYFLNFYLQKNHKNTTTGLLLVWIY